MPKVKAQFRRYKDIPFSIEKLSGVQYRCRVCNKIFLEKKELMSHLESERQNPNKSIAHPERPKPGQMVIVSALYTQDVQDLLRNEFLKLAQNVTFDPDP